MAPYAVSFMTGSSQPVGDWPVEIIFRHFAHIEYMMKNRIFRISTLLSEKTQKETRVTEGARCRQDGHGDLCSVSIAISLGFISRRCHYCLRYDFGNVSPVYFFGAGSGSEKIFRLWRVKVGMTVR